MTHTNKMPQLPPEITATRRLVPKGMVYECEHEHLGTLGRLSSLSHRSGQTQVAIETDGDPDDPLWEERFVYLSAIMRACFEAIGKSRALPQIEEAKASARLYQRFTKIQHSLEMWDFARGVSEQDYADLLAMARHAAQIATPADMPLMQLQLALLQACRQAEQEARPSPANGMYLSNGRRLVKLRRAPESSGGKRPRFRRRKR